MPGRADGGAAHHGPPEFSPLVAKGGRLNLYKLKFLFTYAIGDERGKIITR